MISIMARDTIEQFKGEGLSPSFEDCIRLNALGLKVERGAFAADFAALPRVAFLGDNILVEPSVAVWQWIDGARQLLKGTYLTEVFLTAYVLGTPASKLPRLDGFLAPLLLKRKIERFRDQHLSGFTFTQIEAAVDYALNGDGSEVGENPEPTIAEKEARRMCRAVPEEIMSQARAILAMGVVSGVDRELLERMTIPQADRMIAQAAIFKGADLSKNDGAKATADYYRTADAIHERLIKEQKDGKAVD